MPVPGRRETDMRNSFTGEPPKEIEPDKLASRSSGVMGLLQTFFDPDLNWADIDWLASITSMPIVLKGIQTGEDAVLAARHPAVAGIVVSNHGKQSEGLSLRTHSPRTRQKDHLAATLEFSSQQTPLAESAIREACLSGV